MNTGAKEKAEGLVGAAASSWRRTSLPRDPRWRIASRWRFVACVQALDFLAFFLMSVAWYSALTADSLSIWQLPHCAVAVLVAAMISCVFQSFGLYEFALLARGRDAAARALGAAAMSFGPFLAPLFMQGSIGHGAAVAACFRVAAGFVGIAVLRLPVAALAVKLQRMGVVAHRVYIIADSAGSAASLASIVDRLPDNLVTGRWILPDDERDTQSALEGALNFLRINPVDLVILSLPLSQPDRLVDAARVLRSLPRQVVLAPSLGGRDDILLNRDVLRIRRWPA